MMTVTSVLLAATVAAAVTVVATMEKGTATTMTALILMAVPSWKQQCSADSSDAAINCISCCAVASGDREEVRSNLEKLNQLLGALQQPHMAAQLTVKWQQEGSKQA